MKFINIFIGIFLMAAPLSVHAAPPPRHAVVAPFGVELFTIRTGPGSVNVKERARTIEKNIQVLARELLYSPDEFQIISAGESENIVYGGKVIVGITEAHAVEKEMARSDLAFHYLELIQQAIEAERAKDITTIRLEEAGLAVLILFGMVILIFWINRLYRRIRGLIESRNIQLHAVLNELIDAGTQNTILLSMVKLVRFIVIFGVLYAGTLGILEIIPVTRRFVRQFAHYLIDPLHRMGIAFVHYIPDLMEVVVIIAVSVLITRFLRNSARRMTAGKIKVPGFHPDWAMPTYQIVHVLIIVLTFIFIFPHLPGSDSTEFRGVSVFLGVLLSLGSTSLISNLMSGLVITYMRPFKTGEFIKMGEVSGEVIEKNALVTRIKTPKNEIVTIPNSTLMTAHTINYSTSAEGAGLIVHAKVTVGYDVDWRKVHPLLIEAAQKTTGIRSAPPPFVQQTALENAAVGYEINAYTNQAAMLPGIYSELHAHILDIFARENIAILTPTFVSLTSDG